MAKKNRFQSIEPSAALPRQVKSAISRLNRFESLEIAGTDLTPQGKQAPVNRVLCPNCAQSNEKGRDVCWACYKPLAPFVKPTPAPDQEVCVVLDGASYRSSDPDLPLDIRELIERIRLEGYSDDLMAQWQKEREVRQRAQQAQSHLGYTPGSQTERVHIFQGQRVTVLRLDGKLYKSNDADLPLEIKEIFTFIEKEGLTPALMQHLRLYGTKVKYRPISISHPSDGDLSFWDAAKKRFTD